MKMSTTSATVIKSCCSICHRSIDDEAKTVDQGLVSPQCRTTMSQVSVMTIVTNILGSSIVDITGICRRCFNLLDSIDTLQVQLKFKNSEVVTLYENSRKSALDERTQSQSQRSEDTEVKKKIEVIEVAEPPKKKDKGLLTSDDLKCQICNKTFEKRRYLMDHLRRVHQSAVFLCTGCESRFKMKEDLIKHQKTCTISKHENDSSQSGLRIETTESSGKETFKLTKRKKNNQCHQCDSYFLTQNLLKTHIKTVHEGERSIEVENAWVDETKVEDPVVCSVCNITVNNQYALSIHQGSVHGFERPWGCKICGKNFARHLELVNHKRIHSGDKPFQCDICGARFNQKQNLHTHVRHIHLDERRYKCEACNMKFRRKRLLDCHINSKHKNERPYSCRHCSATFVYPEHLRKHEQTHRGDERVFKCDQCTKKFKSKASLDNHTSASHRPATSYQCLSCPNYYLTKEELLTHLKEASHPRGVYSSHSETSVLPREREVNLPLMETVSVYDDVVLYLASEGVPVSEDDGLAVSTVSTVYVDQVVQPQDEVQTAISSIVEVDQHN